MIEWHITKYGESNSLSDVPEGATIDRINNKFVIGICEYCTRPILEGEQYSIDEEGGIYICSLCF